jgi:hypothetical protein
MWEPTRRTRIGKEKEKDRFSHENLDLVLRV